MREFLGMINNNVKIDQAYSKAEVYLKNHIIKEDDFLGFYSEEEIKKDKEYIKHNEEIFKEINNEGLQNQAKRATIFECIVYQQIELNNLLGEKVYAQKTSRFDDLKSGIDSAVEIEEEDKNSFSYLGLAFDISYTSDLGKKFERIKKEIDAGKLSEIKYFNSPRSGRKTLQNVPRLVLAVDGKTANQMIDMWVNNEKESLANHPIQLQALKEFELQLKTFEKYCRVVNKNNEIADIYKHALERVKKLIDDKKKKFPNFSGEDFDAGYDHIQSGLSIFEKEIEKIAPKEDRVNKAREFFEKYPHLRKKAS